MFLGQQPRFFSPSSNNGNFALPQVQFQGDTNNADLNFPQRRLSSADPLKLPNPSSSSFFSSQQQLPTGTFTNSGPFSRPPNVSPFILNGQQTQFQPLRNSGSLSFVDAVSPPSFFQQAPQRPLALQQQQQQQPQTQQQFNFFPSNSQQQRFRPVLQQQRTEQPDSTENFDGRQNAQPSLILQQPRSQESFNSDSPRRPLSQTNGVIPVSRNPPPTGSIRWWNPTTTDAESAAVSDDDTADGINTNEDTTELVQQRQNQPTKRGRGQPQLAKRRPITTPEPSSTINLEEHQEPAAIGFTVIHDENENRSSWSQPIITTHRPQPGPSAFRNRNQPAVVSGSVINRRPTTFSPLSVAASSSSTIRSAPQQPSALSGTINRQQPTTVRSRKSSLFSTSTTTMNTLDYEQEEEDEEEQTVEEKRQFQPRKSTTTTTQPPPVPITTLRTALRPRINSLTTLIPQQQQRMKKIVNNPAIIQSITTRKPTTTSTTTLAPTTTTEHQIVDEYEEYEDIEHTTTSYTTTELPLNKKHTKFPLLNQSSTVTINQKNNNSSIATTESWVVVASVQTSRSVSSSSSMVGGGTNKNHSVQESTASTASTPTTKHRFNNKPVITTTSTTTVESIIDKLDRVQSELSNGILYGSSSNTNNGSRILTDMQNSGNNDDKRNDVIISSFTTPTTEKTTKTLTSTMIPTTTSTVITSSSSSTTMSTSTIVSSSTTSVPSTTNYISTTIKSEKEEEEEDEDKEEEEKEKEEESDDSDKETTFVRKFVPSKQRTSTVSSITSTSTAKPSIQVGKKKSLIDSVKFDDLLTSGLLPAGFNPKPPPAYKSKTISTTTTTEIPSPVTNNISSPQPKNSSSSIPNNTTPSTTTTKAKSSGLNIKFVDDSSALASLLPPGFKLEDAIKPVEVLSPSLLPPGFKLPIENVEISNKKKEQESILTTVVPTTEVSLTTSTTTITSSTSGIVFPSIGKGTNSSGTRKPLPSNKKMQAAVTVAPTIQKGWPVR